MPTLRPTTVFRVEMYYHGGGFSAYQYLERPAWWRGPREETDTRARVLFLEGSITWEDRP